MWRLPAADTTEETAKVDVAVESTVESAAESAGNAGDTERVEQVEGEVIETPSKSADDAAAVTVGGRGRGILNLAPVPRAGKREQV